MMRVNPGACPTVFPSHVYSIGHAAGALYEIVIHRCGTLSDPVVRAGRETRSLAMKGGSYLRGLYILELYILEVQLPADVFQAVGEFRIDLPGDVGGVMKRRKRQHRTVVLGF